MKFNILNIFKRSSNSEFENYLCTIGEEIAHELRTPLIAIKAGVNGSKDCMNKLIRAYEIAKEKNLDIPDILPQEMKSLEFALNNCEREAYYAISYVNMVSSNLTISKIKNHGGTHASVRDCVKNAIYTFPIKNKMQENMLLDNFEFDDFLVKGDEGVIVQVIQQVIKYLIYLAEQNSGISGINIDTVTEKGNNYLIFSITILNFLSKSINIEYSRKNTDKVGSGLYFCKKSMKMLLGDIDFSQDKGNVRLLLRFPVCG